LPQALRESGTTPLKPSSWFARLEEGLLALLLALMTLITFAQVIARYVFNYSFVWALELVMFLFAGLIFIGISYGIRVGSHSGVDAVVRKLSDRTARVVAIVATLLCLAYTVIVFVGAYTYVMKMYEIGILAQDMPVPQWVPRLVLPLGFALAFVRFAEVLYRLLTGQQARLLGDEVEDAMKLEAHEEAPPPGAAR
jgi:C4-dicarboxylate transporter DctQ subunit